MKYPEAMYRDLFVSSCPARVGVDETVHEDAGGAHGNPVEGCYHGGRVPWGAECPRGAGETGPGTDYGFVQIIVERSYCE